MPASALRPCAEPRCPVLVRSGRCVAHGGERKPWVTSAATPRLRGPANQNRRKALFQREPLCRLCAAGGRVTLATIRDHIVNLKAGGAEGTIENEQPLCKDCHRIKTQAESRQGAMAR